MTRPNQTARNILERINFITIATVSKVGVPWNTPVAAFHFDNDYALYWASHNYSQHSKNIRDNGKAFIVVYDSTPDNNEPSNGVYIEAEAHEITDKNEALEAAKVFKDDPYNPSDGTKYLGDYPRRIYKAVPQKIWVNGDNEINGNFIDVRISAEE